MNTYEQIRSAFATGAASLMFEGVKAQITPARIVILILISVLARKLWTLALDYTQDKIWQVVKGTYDARWSIFGTIAAMAALVLVIGYCNTRGEGCVRHYVFAESIATSLYSASYTKEELYEVAKYFYALLTNITTNALAAANETNTTATFQR